MKIQCRSLPNRGMPKKYRNDSELPAVENALVAGTGLVVVVHVLRDGHENALVALHAVAGLDLRARKDGDHHGKHDGEDAERPSGEDALDPVAEILAQEDGEYDKGNKLCEEQRERDFQVPKLDNVLVMTFGPTDEIDGEGDGDSDNGADKARGV